MAGNREAGALVRLRLYGELHKQRRALVVDALRAGVSASEIQRITGMARTTIARIERAAGGAPGSEADK